MLLCIATSSRCYSPSAVTAQVGCMQVNLLVAEVLSVLPHPNADRLHVVTVDAGNSTVKVCHCGCSSHWGSALTAVLTFMGKLQVVTSAPNVRQGMKVVLAVRTAPKLALAAL